MKSYQFISESAVSELTKRLPKLKKFDYDTIDVLMRDIAKKHDITGKELHDMFVKKYNMIPDDWIKKKKNLKEYNTVLIHRPVLCGMLHVIKEYRKILGSGSVVSNNSIASLTSRFNGYICEGTEESEEELYYSLLKKHSTHVPISIGSKLSLLQVILDPYSQTLIFKGFRNPKTITDIHIEDNSIKFIEFDDGSIFPEEYEYSLSSNGDDLINTFFFNSKSELEKKLIYFILMKPDDYKLGTEMLLENTTNQPDLNDNPIVRKFIDMCVKELDLKTKPNIEFSHDTDQAQSGHHTGRHTPHDGKIWVYARNRNLVDILRTVAHELRHLSQGEKGLIKPDSSYPGSPIEVDADAWAGMIIKIFGKDNREIFQ